MRALYFTRSLRVLAISSRAPPSWPVAGEDIAICGGAHAQVLEAPCAKVPVEGLTLVVSTQIRVRLAARALPLRVLHDK